VPNGRKPPLGIVLGKKRSTAKPSRFTYSQIEAALGRNGAIDGVGWLEKHQDGPNCVGAGFH